jgi:hypothetical protein
LECNQNPENPNCITEIDFVSNESIKGFLYQILIHDLDQSGPITYSSGVERKLFSNQNKPEKQMIQQLERMNETRSNPRFILGKN